MTYLEIPLYPDQPGGVNAGLEIGTRQTQRVIAEVGRPQVSVVVADEPTGAAVVVCPGGGYQRVCVDKEGLDFARVMAGWGITTLTLTYRQPGGRFIDPPLPLQDARRALALAVENAGSWGLDPEKLVLMGFSAGGHLALTTVREPGPGGVLPRYLVLGYPVVSFFPPLVHEGSRDNLLGSQAPSGLVERFSAERNWAATGNGRPFRGPSFLVHSDDDGSVPVGNSLILAEVLRAAGAPVELLRHPTGGHGYGLGPVHGYPSAPDWAPQLQNWMVRHSLARKTSVW